MDGVPVSAWLSGVWYHKDALAAAGIEEPHNWEQLLKASQALNEPAKKHYGIALPTAESVMTEQAFSQFALSGGANVFDANGNVKIDTPEMSKALAFIGQWPRTPCRAPMMSWRSKTPS